MMTKIKQAVIHSLPLLLAMITVNLLWRQNYLLLSLLISAIIACIFLGKDKKMELYIAGAGTIWGMIIEITGARVSGYHTFNKPDFMGIPLWAAVGWGLGFLIAKRVILIFTKGLPFTNNR